MKWECVGSILERFWLLFWLRNRRREKCVWTAQAAADCVSGPPGKLHFMLFSAVCAEMPARNPFFIDFDEICASIWEACGPNEHTFYEKMES